MKLDKINVKLRPLIFFCAVISLCFSCSKEADLVMVENENEPHQLLFSYGEDSDIYVKKHLINFFRQVALGSEFGTGFPFVKKWEIPMKIYVTGNPKQALITELEGVIEELNGWFTDGFNIQITIDSLDSNFHIFFGDAVSYKSMYPAIASLVETNVGLFSFHYNNEYEINYGHMYVDITRSTLTTQKHLLREELTQALGLPNDVAYYRNSIFYEQWSSSVIYDELDIEVIRLLYHPKMVAGFGASTVQSVLEGILGI